MIGIIVVCSLVLGLLLFSDLLFRKRIIGPEVGRKLVHMGAGVIIAFTPYFMEWTYIKLLALLFIAVVLIVSRYKFFKSIQSVKRSTKGEILFAIGILICALLEPANWIFVAAVLHLAVADALAAVVGIRWGKRTRYTLLSHGKSMLGSLTFFYVSMAIMFAAYIFVDPVNYPELFKALVLAPAVLTFIENVSWYGLDNVTIPIMTIILLSGLS